MRNAEWIALFSVVLTAIGCATNRVDGMKDRVQVIAHRGASAYAPENTLAAFRLAYEMGADWFELDCTLTKDGAVIVIHDDSTDRTTGHAGAVGEQTLEELKGLDAGSWKGLEFRGEPLPTLDESLNFAKGRIGVYIEIKDAGGDAALEEEILTTLESRKLKSLDSALSSILLESGSRNVELTHKTIELVRARKMEKAVVIQSFSPIVCATALFEAPEFRTEFLGYLDPEKPGAWEQYRQWGPLLDPAGYNVNTKALDAGMLPALRDGGKTVAVWTVNDQDDMRRYAGMGVNAIITDKPDVCIETLESLGLR